MKTLHFYTDGSCVTSTKRGGYGLMVLDYKYEIVVYCESGCYTNTTNNRMELLAFLQALKYINHNMTAEDEAVIYTDSAYISNCFLNKWYSTWLANGWRTSNRLQVKNVDLWKQILHEYRLITTHLTINKVNSHSGIKYNEAVDKLANEWRGMSDEDFIVDQN